MSDAPSSWTTEIRDYLLGQNPKHASAVSLTSPRRIPARAPARRWWIFEGARFALLGGTLSANWDRAASIVRGLERTNNPRRSLSERADALVDWPATIARGVGEFPRSYVVRSSGIGLDDDERTALHGWMDWIDDEWRQYAERHDLPEATPWRRRSPSEARPTEAQLRRWLHVSRRSRWPFLREIVAETIRPIFEPTALNRIPLPRDRAKLFELLCLVRIARSVAPAPDDLRWLGAEYGDNKLSIDGATVFYQQSLGAAAVLSTQWYSGGLRRSVEAFGIQTPKFVDVAVDFAKPRNGYDGIIAEIKSGGQNYDAAVEQLRVYSSARERRTGAKYVCWGIFENSAAGSPERPDLAYIHEGMRSADDLWVFSRAEFVPDVLSDLGFAAPRPGGA